MYVDRLPPHNLNAEEAVIGSILIDSEAIAEVVAILEPDDFYGEKNSWCFSAMKSLFERGEAINQITVAEELSRHKLEGREENRLSDMGGSAYLSHLVMVVPTSVHIEYYARIVQRASIMRQLVSIGGRISEIGLDAQAPDADDALKEAEEMLLSIRRDDQFRPMSMREILDSYLERVGGDIREMARMMTESIPTGFYSIDELLGQGMVQGSLILLGARPGVGKTALALDIAMRVSGLGHRALICSMEMPSEQLATRMQAHQASLSLHHWSNLSFSSAQESAVLNAIGMLSDLPLHIYYRPHQTVMDIRAAAMNVQARHGLGLIIIDYMQLVAKPDDRQMSEAAKYGWISREMKILAGDLGVPILVCCQLNRELERRRSRRPLLSDLRDSGSLEQDADAVLFLHREDQAYTRDEWEMRRPSEPYPEGVVELILAKNRHGERGTTQLLFDGNTQKFLEIITPRQPDANCPAQEA